jgi:hypothetical protein
VSRAEDKERQHADSIRATAALKEDAYKDKLEDAHVQMRKLSAALEHAMKVRLGAQAACAAPGPMSSSSCLSVATTANHVLEHYIGKLP